MMKLAIFLVSTALSLNAFALGAGDLNSALNGANQATALIAPKMIYGGRDVLNPKAVNQASQSSETTVS